MLSIGMAMVSCSSTDVYDENYAKNAENSQRIAKYEQAFTEAFGQVYKNHQWGFDMTTGITTRQSITSTDDAWVIPDNFGGGSQNKEGWNANDLADKLTTLYSKMDDENYKEYGVTSTLPGFDFSNFFLQHVKKVQGGTIKNLIIRLEAFNSSKTVNPWETVDNFTGGDNPNGTFEVNASTTYFYSPINSSAAGTTLMANMGGNADSNGHRFRLIMKEDKHDATEVEYYNYGFLTTTAYHKEKFGWVEGEHFLVFQLPPKNAQSAPSYWIIRLGEATTADRKVEAEGRVLCEDMGANDFDFNDVVFDAWIMKNGDLKIEILAHGGELDISVAERQVTLDKMSNTGLKTVNTQKFTIPAQERQEKGWNSIASIPVKVYPKGFTAIDLNNESFPLEARAGGIPQKVCAPIGTEWPDEFVKISDAYTTFPEWSQQGTPSLWTFRTVRRLVDLNLGNNSADYQEPADYEDD